MTNRKFVLFDFDGVIADSFTLAYDIAREVHPEAKLTQEGYRAWFHGNVYDSIKEAGATPRDDIFFSKYAKRMHAEVTVMPGIEAPIKSLAESYTLVIISSTASPHIRTLLEGYGLAAYFADVMGSDVHTSKVEKMRMVFEKYGVKASDCVFITDTLGDMREAKKHEVGTIAVAWGWHDRVTLEKGVPFCIVNAPAELVDTVEDYFSTSV